MLKFMKKLAARNIERIKKQATGLLVDGEKIQTAMLASTTGQSNDSAIIVTDLRIMVTKLNFMGKVTEHLFDAPRSTKLGPFKGLLWYSCDSLETHLYISYAFKEQILEADKLAN